MRSTTLNAIDDNRKARSTFPSTTTFRSASNGLKDLPLPPLIRKIKTASCKYVYDTWTNEILKVDDAVFHLLDDGIPDVASDAVSSEPELKRARKEIAAAKREGFFREDYPEIVSFPEEHLPEIVNKVIREGPEHVILNITERCNMRCRYCVYSGAYDFDRTHNNRSMSWETAKKALEWYFGHEEREEFSVGFYGGEPLIVFPLIQRIVAYARERKADAVRFNVTTNCTIHNPEIWKFFVKEGFRLTLSLDGPAPVHDRYRVFRNGKGSFARVWKGIERLRALDEEFFSKNISFSMILAPPVELEVINRFVEKHPEIFEDKSILIAAVNEQSSKVFRRMGVERPYLRGPKEIKESSEVFNDFKTTLHRDGKPAGFSRSYHGREYVKLHQRPMRLMSKQTPSHGQCIPGHRKCFIDTGGEFYMCERVNPAYKIGDLRIGIDGKRVKECLLMYNRFFKDQCRHCWAVRLCEKCYNNVRRGEEWSQERGQNFCAGQRARILHLLTRYCTIREQRDDAFKWAEDIVIV